MSQERFNTPSIFSLSYKTVFQHYPRIVQNVTQMIHIQDVHINSSFNKTFYHSLLF